MAIVLTSTATDRIVTGTWRGAKAKLDPVIEGAAAYWYSLGYGQVMAGEVLTPFASLTIAQKLNVMDEFVKQHVLKAARLNLNANVDAAKLAAETEAAATAAGYDFR